MTYTTDSQMTVLNYIEYKLEMFYLKGISKNLNTVQITISRTDLSTVQPNNTHEYP